MKKFLFLTLFILSGMFFFFIQAGGLDTADITSDSKLEEFLNVNKAGDEVAEAYRFANENPQSVLSKVKCYCGCLENNDHENNKHCFFNDDGSIDSMGLNCGLCVKTALLSRKMLAEGKSVREISDYVDGRWGQR